MAVSNKVQLITYPDSLGGNLKSLKYVLDTYFKDVFQGGIHILPPFPSSGDRGFAPLTYLEIAPEFGNWDDIKEIANEYDILLDLMVNHISQKSEYFQDFLLHGRDSKYADLFITLEKYWPNGIPQQSDVDKMFLRRKEPYSSFTVGPENEALKVWTTFGRQNPSEQIDLDIHAEIAQTLFRDYMVNFSKNKVKIVRLDAVGYIIKKLGTSCFFVEPDIHLFLNWISSMAKSLNIELLPEVHAHYSIQFKLAEKGHWIYDFILPFYVLETLINKSAARLLSYLKIRPEKQFTMLDCHDGVPVKPDLDDLVSSQDAQKIVDVCVERGSNLSLIFSDKHKNEDGFDVHQIRGTIYSMLDKNDDAYIAARAIQFFVPGIPQVYYVGLLAGENDTENVEKTGEGREINRHNYSLDEIENAVQKPVFKRLLRLIKFRNEHPAFDGKFEIGQSESDKIIQLSWTNEASTCWLNIDLNSMQSTIKHTNNEGILTEFVA